jgi:hypothetical protein
VYKLPRVSARGFLSESFNKYVKLSTSTIGHSMHLGSVKCP